MNQPLAATTTLFTSTTTVITTTIIFFKTNMPNRALPTSYITLKNLFVFVRFLRSIEFAHCSAE